MKTCGDDGFDRVQDILILTNYFHPEPTGSAPPITDLALWLAANGIQTHVLTARPSYPANAVYPGYEMGQRDRETFGGAQVRRVRSIVSRSRGLIGRLISETSFALAAWRARERKYSGVVAVCPSVFVILMGPAFRRKGGRLIAIVHDIQSGLGSSLNFGAASLVMGPLRRLESWVLNRCDAIVTLSDAMADEVRALGVVRPIHVIPPQVDVREITPRPLRGTATPMILYSGNLGRKQGLDQVLALAAELERRGSPARILIRGEGSERAALEQAAAAMALKNLSFADLAPRAEISQAMGEAVLHLVPQAPEGASFALPSKIFSIMAAERPFVATAASGTPLHDLCVVSGSGLCVAPGDPAAFADAVQEVLFGEVMRLDLGKAGRRYVETVVDREIVCRNILNLMSAPGPKSETLR